MLSPVSAENLVRRGYESSDLDYKRDFDKTTGAWMELAKDVYGMANYGGGCIIIGVEDGTFEPIGVEPSFHIDSQIWVDKLSKWITGHVEITYQEHMSKVNDKQKKFPILYIHGSVGTFFVPKDEGDYKVNGKTKNAFHKGIIYTRQNTKTISATGEWNLFWSLLERTTQTADTAVVPLETLSVLNNKTKPDSVEENLWLNLFPVTEIPDYIHVAVTDYRYPKDIYNHINDKMRKNEARCYEIPSFILVKKKIYSFSPYDKNNPLSCCVTNLMPSVPISEWLNNKEREHDLIMLLNFNLKNLCRRKRFKYDIKRKRFFIPYNGREPVSDITWKPYKRTTKRKLVNVKMDKNGKPAYCVHFAGNLRFMKIGAGLYLTIEPTRVLTANGIDSLDEKRNIKISAKNNLWYHNNNYLYDVKLWLTLLAGNREEIHFGQDSGKIIVSVRPIDSKVDFGIINDRHTREDFLDKLELEPLEYEISYGGSSDYNPLTSSSMVD